MKKQMIPVLLALAVSSVYAEQTTKYTYNSEGQITSIDGPRNDVKDITQYTYTTEGYLNTLTNPLGQKVTYSNFDKKGNPQTITYANGIASTLTYTAQGWVNGITTNGAKITIAYDKIGQITKITLPDNSTLTYTWDDAKRLTNIKNNLNDSISYTYDAMGNRTQETTKKGTTITKQLKRQFDELGRVLNLIGSQGQTYQYSYGTHNKPLSDTDPKGIKTNHRYNDDNYLTMDSYDKGGEYTYHDRDAHGNVTRAKDFATGNTYYTYDDIAQVTEENSNARGLTKYEYDKAGNLIKQANARGNVTQYSYDALNRLIKQIYPNDSTLNAEFTYDQVVAGYYNIGLLTSINDPSGTTQYNYNNQGLVAQQKNQLKLDGKTLGTEQTTHYTYDKVGRVLNIDFGTLSLKYTRNTGGQVTAVTLTKDGKNTVLANNISYSPFAEHITGLKWGNGLALTRSYDLDGQLTQQKIGTVTTNYQYDLNGNITQVADSQFGTVNYQYNDLNRLIQEQGTDTTTYTYDINGNRTNRTNSQGTMPTSFTNGNSLNYINGGYFTHDAIKNITAYKDKTKRYEYDEANRFSKVISIDANKQETTLARYIHNAYGERSIKVKQDGSISTFLYNDQGQLIEEIQYNANKQKQKEIYWVWLGTLPIAQIDIPFTNNVAGTQTISYLHSDHLNTPRWATNTAKQSVWTWQSDAYGTTMANEDPRSTGTKTTVPLRFPGQYYDEETGFHYNYFRTYIPDLGRYSQSDPIGLEAGWNTFVYVGGNPLLYKDQYGLKVCMLVTRSKGLIHYGTHVALYGTNSNMGKFLYDPNGSYASSHGGGSGDLLIEGGSDWSIEGFIEFHNQDGDFVEETCVVPPNKDTAFEDSLLNIIMDFGGGGGGGFDCAINTTSVLKKTGAFPGMSLSKLPGNAGFPSNIQTEKKHYNKP